MIGKYDEKRLTQQLAQALAATKAAEAGADPESAQQGSGAAAYLSQFL